MRGIDPHPHLTVACGSADDLDERARLTLKGGGRRRMEVVAVGPFERRLRAMINPLSTGLTSRWFGIGHRQVPPRVRHDRHDARHVIAPRTFHGVSSPGH
jgi:hypothetical protein